MANSILLPVQVAVLAILNADGALLALAPSGALDANHAPPETSPPYVLFAGSAEVPARFLNQQASLVTMTFDLEVYDVATSFDTVGALLERIETLLDDVAIAVSGASVVYLHLARAAKVEPVPDVNAPAAVASFEIVAART